VQFTCCVLLRFASLTASPIQHINGYSKFAHFVRNSPIYQPSLRSGPCFVIPSLRSGLFFSFAPLRRSFAQASFLRLGFMSCFAPHAFRLLSSAALRITNQKLFHHTPRSLRSAFIRVQSVRSLLPSFWSLFPGIRFVRSARGPAVFVVGSALPFVRPCKGRFAAPSSPP
jgi:hypothetical protein